MHILLKCFIQKILEKLKRTIVLFGIISIIGIISIEILRIINNSYFSNIKVIDFTFWCLIITLLIECVDIFTNDGAINEFN